MLIDEAYKIIKEMQFGNVQHPTLVQIKAIESVYAYVKDVELERKVLNIIASVQLESKFVTL